MKPPFLKHMHLLLSSVNAYVRELALIFIEQVWQWCSLLLGVLALQNCARCAVTAPRCATWGTTFPNRKRDW